MRLLIAGLLGGVVLGSLVFAVLWASYLAPADFEADLAYLPDDCDVLLAMQVDQIVGSDARMEYLGLLHDLGLDRATDFVSEFGLGSEDIVHVAVAGRLDLPREARVAVVRTRKPVAVEEVLASWQDKQYTKTPVGKYTLYTSTKTGRAVAAPEKNVLVYGMPDRLQPILARERKAFLSSGMRALLKKADFSQSFVNVVNGEAESPNPLVRPPFSTQRLLLERSPGEQLVNKVAEFVPALKRAAPPPLLLDDCLGMPTRNPMDWLFALPNDGPHHTDDLARWRRPRGMVQQARVTWDIEETLVLSYASDEDARSMEQTLSSRLDRQLSTTDYRASWLRTLGISTRSEDVVLEYRYHVELPYPHGYPTAAKKAGPMRIMPPLPPGGPPGFGGKGMPLPQGGPAAPPPPFADGAPPVPGPR